ncbi:MAG TPA: hypothetical protein VJ810_42475 [Blastocatellia bacterium]|nr:hypothetical protein [Blastocatellia bacterium]
MANKRSHNISKGAHSGGDNFRAINGVSSIVESCLHRAGILTYAQFASLSPDDIITIVGNVSALSPDRVAKQNWIGQARELALRIPSNESKETSEENSGGILGEESEGSATGLDELRIEQFVIELLLDHDRSVIQTRVTHQRTGKLEEWDSWLEKRLINFLARQAGIREVRASGGDQQQPFVEKTAPEGKPAAKPVAEPLVESDKNLTAHKLEVWTSGSDAPANLARHDQPFDVRLKIGTASLAAPVGGPLVYNAVFDARSIGARGIRSSIRVSGKIEQPDNPSITIKGIYLEPGSYALNASVIFNQPGEVSKKSGALRIQAESSLLHIY